MPVEELRQLADPRGVVLDRCRDESTRPCCTPRTARANRTRYRRFRSSTRTSPSGSAAGWTSRRCSTNWLTGWTGSPERRRSNCSPTTSDVATHIRGSAPRHRRAGAHDPAHGAGRRVRRSTCQMERPARRGARLIRREPGPAGRRSAGGLPGAGAAAAGRHYPRVPSFRALVGRARASCLATLSHRHTLLETVLTALGRGHGSPASGVRVAPGLRPATPGWTVPDLAAEPFEIPLRPRSSSCRSS